eukprot:5065054-Pyramimonas_sp.AAC.1
MQDQLLENKVEALREARRERKFYDARRISRLVAGTRRGSRGRMHARAPTTRASALEWISQFLKQGIEGGAGARVLRRCQAPQLATVFGEDPLPRRRQLTRVTYNRTLTG